MFSTSSGYAQELLHEVPGSDLEARSCGDRQPGNRSEKLLSIFGSFHKLGVLFGASGSRF